MTNVSEIRLLSDEELVDKVRALEEERGKLRFRAATEDIDKPSRFHEIRLDIARLKTVAQERRRSAAKGQVSP